MSSTLRLNPPFRADHIGSLKRPEALLKKRAEFEAKKCSHEELRTLEDETIREIVDMQRKAGIRSFTDGEFRRHMFYDGVFDNLDGMQFIPEVPPELFKDYVPDVAAFKKLDFKGGESYLCKGKLKRTKPFYRDQFEFLKSIVSPEELPGVKLTIAAPEWFHLRHGEHAYDQNVYKNDAEYFADIAVAYQEEIKDLYSRGCRNIQFDDPLLAYFCAESMLSGMKEVGVDSEALLDTYIKAYNDCLKDRPRDMTVGLHLCRGNFKDGMHFSEGGYDNIARKLFNEIDVDTYYLEYDTQRAGTFEPLKHLPPHKSVVLGVVSSKLPALEHVENVKRRVHEAAETIAQGDPKRSKEEALNQICLSPQCGFASHSEGNRVTMHDVERKLQLVVAISQEIW